MYLPSRFENSKTQRAIELMQKYPLATLISHSEEGLFVSHLPLVADRSVDEVNLVGHLARANPHWRMLDQREVYVIFNGPNAYITPAWYAENDVPTWNYAVVHMKGTCRLIQDPVGIQKCLEKLTDFIEAENANPWKFWIPDDLSRPGLLEASIVGFTIRVESIQSKFKLSQNRSELDRQRVVSGLLNRQDDMSHEIAKLMKE